MYIKEKPEFVEFQYNRFDGMFCCEIQVASADREVYIAEYIADSDRYPSPKEAAMSLMEKFNRIVNDPWAMSIESDYFREHTEDFKSIMSSFIDNI